MSGWRARIGIISPIGESVERAFNQFAPEGVAINSTKIWFPGPSEEGLIFLSDQLEETAKLFARQRHDLVFFGCTSGSLVRGIGFDKECIARIEKTSGTQALTTTTAVMEAFDLLGKPPTAVITPYPEETNELERRFLEDSGIQVSTIVSMKNSPVSRNIRPSSEGIQPVEKDATDMKESEIYRFCKEMDLCGAECLFVSCAGLNTMGIVEILEEDLGIPVITSNQAGVLSALRHCGVGVRLPHMGKLSTL